MSESVIRYDLNKDAHYVELVLDRPRKLNAMGPSFFDQLDQLIERAMHDDDVRAILITANGKGFTAGLDLTQASSGFMSENEGESVATKSSRFMRTLLRYQSPFFKMSEHSQAKPIVCAVHGACIGGGVDLASACDVRLAEKSAYFSIREIRVGMVADIGTLQRIERIMNPSAAREMAFTGGNFSADQMKEWGFLSHVYANRDELVAEARKLTAEIAAQSALVLSGVKTTLRFARDHSIPESFKQVGLWNAAFLQSDDLMEAMSAYFEKRKPVFKAKL